MFKMFSGSTLVVNKSDVTSASFESDPPYEFSWAREGSLMFKCDNWGNVDNTLTVNVYWGIPTRGVLATNANIVWALDDISTVITATGGTTTDVAGFLLLPKMKSRYMKLIFTLTGTSKEVDVVGWFYGKS